MEILFFLFIAYFIYLNFSPSSNDIDYNPSIDYKIDDGHLEEKKRLAEKNSSFFLYLCLVTDFDLESR